MSNKYVGTTVDALPLDDDGKLFLNQGPISTLDTLERGVRRDKRSRIYANIVGGENVGFAVSGTTTVRTLADRLTDIKNVKDYGAVGDGVTDDATAINAAITAAAVVGGIVFFPAATYKHNTAITLASNVFLWGTGVTLSWGGGATAQVTSSTTGVLLNPGIIGITIDGLTSASKLLELYSPYHGAFRDVTLKSNLATNFALDVLVNSSGATNPDGNRNSAFNAFDNCLQEGTCGTALRLKGTVAVGVVTLNTFSGFNGRGASIRGVDFDSWCDSNYFSGMARVNVVADSGIGVEWNTGSPTSNVGVYANNFDHLAVDTFGVMSGRIGFRMNWTKLNKVNYYYNSPVAEGGAYVITSDCQSYYVVHQTSGTSNLVIRTKLAYHQGKDNPQFTVGGDDITTETTSFVAGTGRTGSGFSQLALIGDTTYTGYGVRLLRGSGGANTNSTLSHRGTGALILESADAGASIIVAPAGGTRFTANDTGIGFYTATPVAQPASYGTPTNVSKTASLPGTTATLAQVGGTLAALIVDLKAQGLIAA